MKFEEQQSNRSGFNMGSIPEVVLNSGHKLPLIGIGTVQIPPQPHERLVSALLTAIEGMMNNCWFRVKMSVCKLHRGEIGLVFEHPTVPGNQSGGWMARQKQKQLESDQLKKSMSTPFLNTSSHQLPMSKNLMPSTPTRPKAMLEQYRIAELITSSSSPSSAEITSTINQSASAASALTPGKKIPCKLISKTSISHNVRLFHFSLPSPDLVLGLPVGKHVFLCAVIDGKLCMRAYTPTSAVDEVGHFDLLVEIYFKGIHPKFPNGGLMTQHLDSLPIGSTIEVKGPLAKRLVMIAGGSGITPIYPVMQAILKDPSDRTEMYVVYANRTEDDVLLREEMDEWAKKHQNVKVWYVVSEAKREGWEYSTGRITERMLKEHIPEGSTDTLALLCGPPAMIHSTVLPNLEKMGYDIKNSCLTF
ncbi:hypothetical protein MRB53_015086 [Persea americana]|uniref:Uncharacterized protein n=1 Tax=Persea americana TaxID=3435 RepID=A0ACC2KCN6_PERAE|nr:hypothetical protein MRB53_015086 [Persea americana]